MLDKYLPVIGVAGVSLLVVGYFTISAPREAARKDRLTFSNTSSWDQDKLAAAKQLFRYPADIYSSVTLPPPPKNSSKETSAELATLKSYRELRTSKGLQDIFAEVNMDAAYFNGNPLIAYLEGDRFPSTVALLKDAFHDLEVIEMQQKEKFDRVRPSILDTSLETAVAVPRFPAYPSYHSTEAYFIAYVFGELAPPRKEEFVARAEQIALNREIAGVHYPSDSAAGALLAQQLFDVFMKSEKFLGLLEAAKKEWAMHPELSQARATP